MRKTVRSFWRQLRYRLSTARYGSAAQNAYIAKHEKMQVNNNSSTGHNYKSDNQLNTRIYIFHFGSERNGAQCQWKMLTTLFCSATQLRPCTCESIYSLWEVELWRYLMWTLNIHEHAHWLTDRPSAPTVPHTQRKCRGTEWNPLQIFTKLFP